MSFCCLVLSVATVWGKKRFEGGSILNFVYSKSEEEQSLNMYKKCQKSDSS